MVILFLREYIMNTYFYNKFCWVPIKIEIGIKLWSKKQKINISIDHDIIMFYQNQNTDFEFSLFL